MTENILRELYGFFDEIIVTDEKFRASLAVFSTDATVRHLNEIGVKVVDHATRTEFIADSQSAEFRKHKLQMLHDYILTSTTY